MRRAGGTEQAADRAQDAWSRYPARWNRLSELRGAKVRNRGGSELGTLSDVSIDPRTGRILYGVVTRGDRLHAVPWSAITMGPDHTATIDADEKLFEGENGFTADRWPNMSDRQWTDETYRRYDAEPYWSDDDADDEPGGAGRRKEDR